jgi:hypothetical protein
MNALSPQGQSRPAVQGIASGIFFLTFFGALWGFLSASFMSGSLQVVLFILIGLVTLGFLWVGIMLLRHAHSLPKSVSPEEAAIGKRIGLWFSIVFGIEIVLIVLASNLLPIFNADRFIPAVVALIVGLHFLPLARLFRVPAYYITGALLSVLSLVAILAPLLGLQIGGPSPYNWSMFVGIGAMLILWLTLFYISRYSLRMLGQTA